jgi:hypothetical protein
LGLFLPFLESPQQVRFNKFYFTISRANVWKILIFEWILLLEIQTNCKNWVWKEESVHALNVFTLGPTAQAITTIYGTATFATGSPLNRLTSVFPFHQFSDVAKG